MKIGTAAEMSALPAKTIRYYEEIGLVTPGRGANGYREYSNGDVHELRFVQRSRSLGFSIEECRHLLALYRDKSRASADVKSLAAEKLSEIDRKLEELDPIERTLLRMGIFEFRERLDVPYKVVINEAVALAKKFGATDSHKYINGVLDRAARQLRKGETDAAS